MNNAQKVIKYVAIVFAIGLIVSIVSSILTGVFAFLGISAVIDVATNNVEVMDYVQEYININSIDMDISTVNLEIIPADTLKVEATGIPVDYKFEQENGELKIKNKKVSQNAKLVLYIPRDVNKLDLDIGAGKIEMEDITVQELSLDTGAATTAIKGLKVLSKLDIDAGVGDISIKESDVSNLDMDAGVGNIEYNGYLRGKSSVDCGIGNVDMNLEGTEEMYNIIAERGIGELKINGIKLSGSQILGTGKNILKLSGGIGSLAVTY